MRKIITTGMALLASPALMAAEVEPRISVGVTHTDNVQLQDTDGTDETIYRIEPGLSLDHQSDHFRANINYLLQALYYDSLSDTEVFHQYDVSFRGDFIPEALYVEVGGRRSQTIVDPAGAIPGDNLPITSNRQDRDEYYVTPGFQVALSQSVIMRGDYRRGWVENGADDLQSADVHTANFSIDNYSRGQGATWALRYNWDRALYDLSPPFENQNAIAELGFWVSGNTRVFASGGLESPWDDPLNPSMEDSLWEVGFAHQAGDSIRAEFAAGDRSFGSSLRGDLNYEFRRGQLALSYNQQPITQAFNPFRIGDIDDPLRFDDFVNVPGSAERFVNERLQFRIDYALQRTTFAMTVFDNRQTERTTAEGDPLEDEKQQGVNGEIGYRLGARTTVTARGGWSEQTIDTLDDPSTLVRGSLGLTYRLGQSTDLTFNYDYVDQEGNDDGRSYRANNYSLILTRVF